MKRLAFILGAFVLGLGVAQGTTKAASTPPTDEGIGSCYEVKPICIQGHPQCICDLTQHCAWACM